MVPGVAGVEIVETDARERAVVADFVAMPSRASVAYQIRYAYEDDARRLRWQTTQRGERTLEGVATFEPTGDGSCRLRYAQRTWSAASMPMWAKHELERDRPDLAAAAFRRWAEEQS